MLTIPAYNGKATTVLMAIDPSDTPTLVRRRPFYLGRAASAAAVRGARSVPNFWLQCVELGRCTAWLRSFLFLGGVQLPWVISRGVHNSVIRSS